MRGKYITKTAWLLIVAVLSFTFVIVFSEQAATHPDTVSESIDGGAYFIDMEYDIYDNLHIAYTWEGSVKYARKFEGKWTGQTQFSGDYPSLVLDKNAYPHIAYVDQGMLVHVVFNGMSWHSQYVTESGAVVYPSLALDSSGRPHISFADRNDLTLHYAYYDGSDWHVENVDSGMSEYWEHLSMDVDTNDIPHIAYRSNEVLKYASRDPVWSSVTLDSRENTGIFCSLAIDTNNTPHISYWTNSDWQVRYYKGGSFFDVGEGSYTKIDVDPGNYAQILFYDDHNVYYWANGSSAFIETIGSQYNENWRIEIAVNSKGQPALAYWSNDLGLIVNDMYAAPSSTRVIQGLGGSLIGSDGTTLNFPYGSFTDTVVMTHTPKTASVTGALASSGYAFALNAVYSNTGQIAQLAPGANFTTIISYTHIGPVIENPNLGLYWWDESTSAWSLSGINNVVNLSSNVITSEVSHLSQFALLGDTNRIYMAIILR